MKQKEIKFKAKNKKGDWIFGMPTYDFIYIFNEDQYDSVDNYEIIPETLCQYSGMKDKNGVEVYEGDKTSAGEIVLFRNGSFITTYEGDTQNGNILTEKRCQYIDIIGNIHD